MSAPIFSFFAEWAQHYGEWTTRPGSVQLGLARIRSAQSCENHSTLFFFVYRSVSLQFDFVELLDGRRLLSGEVASAGVDGPVALQRSLVPVTTHNTGFIQYMDSGIWHLAFYNDGKETETVSFITTAIGEYFYLTFI